MSTVSLSDHQTVATVPRTGERSHTRLKPGVNGRHGIGHEICRLAVALLPAFTSLTSPAASPQSAGDNVDLFENKIRPLFADHCYTCHSEKAEKVKGGLRLDTPETVSKGGSSGPVIVPGNPDASLLIKAVRYLDPDLQMPPKDKKLTHDQVAILEAWVKIGAPMPHSAGASSLLVGVAEARARHWAFQPIHKPSLPAVKHPAWVETPLDDFVLAELEKKHLKPAPPANRQTLIRRVTYDLTGLPPTYAEVEAFLKDKRPDAYSRLVDRLLASPHYGERWGRYWLDVARYADTKGYLAGGEQRRFAFSYTYRDYVIRAFNEDKPYDQFLVEQIAADRLPLAEDKQVLAALGFLTLGRRFLNDQNDIIDDRIDVVTRGTLGLTVGCARCHDHKFDPIPSRDYYALHGVFASSEEPGELPLLGALPESADYQDYLKQKAKIEAELAEFRDKETAKFIGELRQQVGDYLLGAHDAAGIEAAKFETFAGEHKLNPKVLRRWMTDLDSRVKKPGPIFGPWFELAKFPEAGFSTNASAFLAGISGDPNLANPVLAKAFSAHSPDSLKAAAEVYTKLFQETDSEWKAALASAAKEKRAAPAALANPDSEAVRQVLYAEGAPGNLTRSLAEEIQERRLGEGGAPFRNRIEALSWTHPGAPPRAMALVDRAHPANSHVLKRGSPANPGEEVPRRFLEILSGPDRLPFTNGSGRLELARAIASPENPLTARVYVNRVWLHHFGEGFVPTPGDFGVRTEAPVHRALLDYLAASFVENGWSTKYLHRLILLSATYRQSSDASPATVKADPENRLFSRFNRQRLDFEALRDTLLALTGTIDLRLGGLPVDIETEPFSTRRTVYALIERQNLPGLFRTFDFANPDTSSQRRFHTTVPQQALFLMNSPFVLERARALAQRPEIKSAGSPDASIRAVYRALFQRPPAPDEVRLGEKFLAASSSSSPDSSPLERYAQVLLLSNELIFVD
ncbi:MAG TPA: PSD1 and planctomycete cytochrome C domain-containing protein [Candidatus Acidoferrum sp.]|nr:PSD1 and planctomycete cytochrome C domain-containing protein [Candidatus Acidoferrum sp.]